MVSRSIVRRICRCSVATMVTAAAVMALLLSMPGAVPSCSITAPMQVRMVVRMRASAVVRAFRLMALPLRSVMVLICMLGRVTVLWAAVPLRLT